MPAASWSRSYLAQTASSGHGCPASSQSQSFPMTLLELHPLLDLAVEPAREDGGEHGACPEPRREVGAAVLGRRYCCLLPRERRHREGRDVVGEQDVQLTLSN